MTATETHRAGDGAGAPRSQLAQLSAEFAGTAFLLMAVVGSGIMAERLTTDVGLQLLMNSIATCAPLAVLILMFAKVSGAHFNPAVTITALLLRQIDASRAAFFIVAQVAGAVGGVIVANLMFDLQWVHLSTKGRDGGGLLLGEVVATLGLLLLIHGTMRFGESAVALSVAGWITGAYIFTSSTSFANPAVTLARTLSDTFAGIDPTSAPAFIAVQLVVVAAAVPLIRLWFGAED